jgi:hypothetical protein
MISQVRRGWWRIAALALVAAVGCVDLTQPPSLGQRPEVPPVDGGAGGSAATDPDAAVDAGEGGSDGAVSDAAAPDVAVDAADAASGIDVATSDLPAPVVDMAADAPDAIPDVPGPEVPLPPADATGDLAEVAAPAPTISFTDPSSFVYAPGTGGTDFTAPCPGPSQAIIGVIGTSGGVVGVNSLQATCGVLEVIGAPSFQLTTRPSATLGPFGAVRPTPHDGTCPANQAFVGFEGASGSWLNSLYVYCAPLTVTQSGSSYTVTVGAPARLPTRFGSDGGVPFAARFCPAGQLAVGILGGAGSAIDRLGLLCARPVAQ